MNLLELWWLLEKPAFQEVASRFHKKFDLLSDHNWFSCESVHARDLGTFSNSWNCRPVVLAASADGSMLHHFVIFKGKRKLKNLSVPRGWVVTVQQKGWMDADLMKHWVQEIWLKYTSRRKALLVIDSFSAHCTEEIRDLLSRNNTDIALIPGGCTCTSKLQPLDMSLN